MLYVWLLCEQVFVVLDGDFGVVFVRILEDKNIKVLVWWENGYWNVMNFKCLIVVFVDFEGLKVWVMFDKVWLEIFEQMGVQFVLLVFGEFYLVFQQGVFDVQENFLLIIWLFFFFEVQKYVLMMQYVWGVVILVLFKFVWDKLLFEDQEIVVVVVWEWGEKQWQMVVDFDVEMIVNFKDKGMEFNDVDCVVFEVVVELVWDRNVDVFGFELMLLMECYCK